MPRKVNPTVGEQMDKHVGMRVRARRQHVGVTAGALGRQLGLTRQTIDKWENGQARMSVGQLFEVASALEINPGWFFEGHPAQTVYDFHAQELDLALQIPDAVAVLMHYSRLDETQRAAVLVLMEATGRGQPQTIDGKGKPLELVRAVGGETDAEDGIEDEADG